MDMQINVENYMEVAQVIMDENAIIWAGNEFYNYRDGVYKVLPEEKLKRLIMETVGKYYTRYKANEILDIIKAQHYIENHYLNPAKYINLKNGIFDVSRKKLSMHNPNYLSTIQLPINYNPAAKCPRWHQYLKEVFEGDQDKINLLQQIYGYCLTKSNKYQVAFFFEGPGATGKSTAAKVLKLIVGEENTAAVSLEQLKNNHYVAMLYGKQLNLVVENKANTVVDDAKFKAIVSGDPIQADKKFNQPFMFKPFCKLVYCTNNMPRVYDSSDAFYRRVVIVNFNRQFKEGDKDPHLIDKLVKEKDGIFIWALQGVDKLEQQGQFILPQQVKDEVDKYRKENTHVMNFVEEECELAPNFKVTKNALYETYQHWTKRSGYKALGKANFGKQLQQIFREVSDHKKNTGWLWVGIGLIREQ